MNGGSASPEDSYKVYVDDSIGKYKYFFMIIIIKLRRLVHIHWNQCYNNKHWMLIRCFQVEYYNEEHDLAFGKLQAKNRKDCHCLHFIDSFMDPSILSPKHNFE